MEGWGNKVRLIKQHPLGSLLSNAKCLDKMY